jgi:tetratricopeptide (TPR) repeat protein
MSMKETAITHGTSILLLISLIALPAASQEVELDQRLVAMAGSAAELEAANAIDAEESAINVLTLSDAWLTEYPESEIRHTVLLTRLRTYVNLNNNQGALTAGEAYIAAESGFYDAKIAEIEDPSDVDGFADFQHNHFANSTYAYQSMMTANRGLNRVDETARYGDLAFDSASETWNIQSQILERGSPEYQEADQRRNQAQLFFLENVMAAYQSANNADKTIEYAERALRIDPQSLATLITISQVMSERPPASELQREAHFESAEEYAEQALDVLENFLEAAGAQLGAQQRAALLSGAHFALGTVYLNQEEWGDAQDEFEEALESVPTDAIAYLRLGMAYARDDEAEDALEALARSVFLNGPDQARELLEQIYEVRNDDLTGMDAFIQSQGAEISR